MVEINTSASPEEEDLRKIYCFNKELMAEQLLIDLEKKVEDPDHNTDRFEYFNRIFSELEDLGDKRQYESLRRSQQLRNTLTEAFGDRATEIMTAWRKTQRPLNIDNS